MSIWRFLALMLVIVICPGIGAQAGRDTLPAAEAEAQSLAMGDPQLDTLWIDEKNGEMLPLETVFRNESGEVVTLGQLIDKPTLILPIYFYCPNSCSLNLMNLATAVKRSRHVPGKDYGIIAFSFNEEEDEENARIAKKNYLGLLPRDFPEEQWKFLTGSKESIATLTQAIGYTYKPLEDGTFIHPSALVAVAEDGMIIKYAYGSFISGDVDMAVEEARRGAPATSVRRFLDYCFNYDPQKSRSFFQYIKFSVLAGFVLFGILFTIYVKKAEKKRRGIGCADGRTGKRA